MLSLSEERLRSAFGLGVAGNFAGHLEQAGEDRDFRAVTANATAPKGVFPFYVPGADDFLGTYPNSPDRIAWTDAGDLQIEPEAGLLCAIDYDGNDVVRSLAPQAIFAFNDCSARREAADKISEKKNWGACSKGVATLAFEVSEIERDGACADLRIACFLRRGDMARAYGVDSSVTDYSYFGTQLLDWIVERLKNQTSDPGSPLENVGELLACAGSPREILIGVGATRYSPTGESTFLQPSDESIVILYDASRNSSESVSAAVGDGAEQTLEAASILNQLVS